jgi:predicted Zn-dependent protease
LPGQLGIARNQLLIVPAARVDAMAGEAYAKQTSDARAAGTLNKDEAMTARVKSIAGRLISEVGVYRPEAGGWNWQVNVIDSNQLNAYCMPGGRIVVYSGLIRRLNLSDAEIAGVVGHEISHALREHSREKASQQVLGNAIVQGIANSGARNASSSAALAAVGAQLFLHLPFSREMEIEADAMGLELAARAGYDPREAMEIWRKFQREDGAGSTPEFLRTHPTHERRIAESELIAQKVLALYQPRDGDAMSLTALPKPNRPTSTDFTIPVAPAEALTNVDKGGHPGFDPKCRWVNPKEWSCK